MSCTQPVCPNDLTGPCSFGCKAAADELTRLAREMEARRHSRYDRAVNYLMNRLGVNGFYAVGIGLFVLIGGVLGFFTGMIIPRPYAFIVGVVLGSGLATTGTMLVQHVVEELISVRYVCPVCEKPYTLTRDGHFPQHGRTWINRPRGQKNGWNYCSGSRQPVGEAPQFIPKNPNQEGETPS